MRANIEPEDAAFACPVVYADPANTVVADAGQAGLTVRAYMATHIAAGLAATGVNNDSDAERKAIANDAVAIADLLIERLNK